MKPCYPVLLVEDEPHIAEGLIFNLQAEGYQVTHVENGEAALEHLAAHNCALVVLDVMLPGMNGLHVCRRLREAENQVPILMLTARGEEEDRIAGLSEGADDYLTKPFSLKEFLLRVSGMLRRSNWQPRADSLPDTYLFGSNRIKLADSLASTPRGEFELTQLELRMLRIFFRKEGQILSRGELLESVWGMAPDTETRTLDNFIVRLRKYFEKDPSRPEHFLTVRGRGYKFIRKPSPTTRTD
mgnify:CR=1 FL=1|jgi:DNA-binding response OmpR family regulator